MTGRAGSNRGDAYDQAADWFVRLARSDLSPGDRAAFERWHADADNAAAYAAVRRSWALAGQAPGGASPGQAERVDGLVAAARAQLVSRPRRRSAVAVASVLAVTVAGTVLWRTLVPEPVLDRSSAVATSAGDATPQVYVTAVGERSAVTLDDGTQVSLNTDSRLQVEFSAAVRRVKLSSGQALFEVASDIRRPFVVTAGNHDVVALGTAFDVRLDARSVQVTLIEGSVSVAATSAAGGSERTPTRLDPGQQYRAGGASAPEVRDAQLAQVTSWREGRLIFSDEPLRAAVTEVNRYSTRKIRLQGDGLAGLRVSGVFRTGRPDSFADALTSYFDIVAVPDPSNGDIVLHPVR